VNRLILLLGIRNIFRNRRRSWITASVIAVGLLSMILAHGFIDGFMLYLINGATADFFGQSRYRTVAYEKDGKVVIVTPNGKREADFLIVHPKHGYLCVEVKGGGVGFEGDTGYWYSIDRHNVKHAIKNPVEQALRAKYSILTKLRESLLWGRHSPGHIVCGHAVFLPDINDAAPITPARHPNLVGAILTFSPKPANAISRILASTIGKIKSCPSENIPPNKISSGFM